MQDTIYVYNITELNRQGYDFKWKWSNMPSTTEFQDKSKIKKYVGFIHRSHSVKQFGILNK